MVRQSEKRDSYLTMNCLLFFFRKRGQSFYAKKKLSNLLGKSMKIKCGKFDIKQAIMNHGLEKEFEIRKSKQFHFSV